MTGSRHTLAVALHDIEPATFERCALIRDWLDDHGVNRVTLLVIPARDLHPLAERSPEMVSWLVEREHGGDAIAQHGFQHLRSGRARGWAGGPYQSLRTLGADRETEFVGLDAQETRRAVDAGRRVLKLAGIEPRGFVAPGYAYTPALRQTLSERFHWWTALLGLHRAHPARTSIAAQRERRASTQSSHRRERRELLGPPITLSSSGRLRSALSPALLRAGALVSGATLRLDLHPSDLDHPNHMLALEWVLKRSASNREAVTYEELAAGEARATLRPRPIACPRPIAALPYPPENSDGLSGFTSERPPYL
jgi:predicted deacetylase